MVTNGKNGKPLRRMNVAVTLDQTIIKKKSLETNFLVYNPSKNSVDVLFLKLWEQTGIEVRYFIRQNFEQLYPI